MKNKYSKRMNQVPRSFIRDILKVATAPNMISFAGGLPNPKFFPVQEIKECTYKVLSNNPNIALQYGLTQGLPELRNLISDSYRSQGIEVNDEQILITSGSQQALDLIGKVFINPNDTICLEEPSYLGAIQAFSIYSTNFTTIPLTDNGIDPNLFEQNIIQNNPKLTYLIPNFQNPTGTSYSQETKIEIARTAEKHNSLIIEDDPYGKLSFNNQPGTNIFKYALNNTILLGSFSKILAPGLRLGWIVANKEIINSLEKIKQATDLHTNALSQSIASEYMANYNVNEHISRICNAYKIQAEAICNAIQEYFPKETRFVEPKGGMFTWLTLPDNKSSLELFNKAKEKQVAFVPGVPFYINKSDSSSLRLNFSCLEPDRIKVGIKILSQLL